MSGKHSRPALQEDVRAHQNRRRPDRLSASTEERPSEPTSGPTLEVTSQAESEEPGACHRRPGSCRSGRGGSASPLWAEPARSEAAGPRLKTTWAAARKFQRPALPRVFG